MIYYDGLLDLLKYYLSMHGNIFVENIVYISKIRND